MMTYQEQIKHPKWQKKRLEVLEASGYECQNCGDKEEQLHVHHPFYKRGAVIWEYESTELECLCTKCHKDAHALDERIKKEIAYCHDKHRILGYVTAMNAHHWRVEKEDPIAVDTWEMLQGMYDYLSTFCQDDRKEMLDAYETMVARQRGKTVMDYVGAVTLAKWKLQGVFDQETP